MPLPGRQLTPGSYRYGFNGKELDANGTGMGGGGNTYDYGFRIYNTQIAKFLSVDPLTAAYPMLTPYQYASNNPIMFIDLDGLEGVLPMDDPSGQGMNTVIEVQNQFSRNSVNYKLAITHNTIHGQSKTIYYEITQSKSHPYSNGDYLRAFTVANPKVAIQATLLAGIIDPAAGYRPGFNDQAKKHGYQDYNLPVDRKNSVMGAFTSQVAAHTKTDFQKVAGSYGKVFRHQVYSGLLYSIYGESMAKSIGDYNEMGDKGTHGLFKLDRGLLGTADLMNNAYGIDHMKSFVEAHGEIENIDDFTSYLNFVAGKITDYEGFKETNGANVQFTSETKGVKKLYKAYKNLKKENSSSD